MGIKKRHWVVIILIAVSLIVGIIIGIFVSGQPFTRKFLFSRENKIDTILGIINEEYVDSVYMKDLVEKAIPHIIDELDPHSSYIPQKEASGYTQAMEGSFGGIGITLGYFDTNDTLIISRITPQSPADQAGMLAGDRIILIDDSTYLDKGYSTDDMLSKVRGQVGTTLKLSVMRRNSDELIEYNIMRQPILVESVAAAYEVADGIGLIKIYDAFSLKTHEEFLNALAKLKSIGCHHYIIDLRGNGGGTLDAALNIANEFLPLGRLIVYAEGKSFPGDKVFANGTGSLQEGQVVILMDQLSASASEVLAGAIQDNDRGLIIGQRSYGKGLIQNHIELIDGSALRLTIARYYTPSGRNIQRPYEMGKGKEYNMEWVDQLLSDGNFYEDSIKFNPELAYQTHGGRTVYGGGGIIPDIFVPLDTTSLTTYYMQLEKKDLFNHFGFYYSDKYRDTLNEFKTYAEMLEYLEEQPILWQIVNFAEDQGVKRRSNLIYKSTKPILRSAYACILRLFFGDAAFYPVYMDEDPVIAVAIETIAQGMALPHSIEKEKYKKKN